MTGKPASSDRGSENAGPLEVGAIESPSIKSNGLRTIEPPGDRDDILCHDLPQANGYGAAQLDEADDLPSGSTEAGALTSAQISRSLFFRLYTSHFLSTWNSRLFEAAVVYFLAAIFPNNLLPISIYALLRNVVAIVLTAPVGAWIDRGNRLTVVRTSILGQRISVAASCALFRVMLKLGRSDQLTGHRTTTKTTYGLFAATVVLACVEKLSAGINLVSVERDWVVVITEGNENARRTTNARLRRIDLFCKLVGPLAISLIAAASIRVAIYTTLGMNLASVLVEYLFIQTVFRMVPTLRRTQESSSASQERVARPAQSESSEYTPRSIWQRIQFAATHLLMLPSLRIYFGHPAVIPSFALSLLYFTVLSFSGQMLTYLLASDINLWQVGLIRGISTIFELSATWIAPRLMKRIGVIRTGLWSLAWQMTWLAGGFTWLFYYYAHGIAPTNVMPAAGLAGAVALSRVGLWGYDLSAQNIVQDEVQGDRRGTFSTVETSIQNFFDLLSWVLTIIWSNPASFQWPVLISVAAVYTAGGLYAYYLRCRRGHLVHLPQCMAVKLDGPSSLLVR